MKVIPKSSVSDRQKLIIETNAELYLSGILTKYPNLFELRTTDHIIKFVNDSKRPVEVTDDYDINKSSISTILTHYGYIQKRLVIDGLRNLVWTRNDSVDIYTKKINRILDDARLQKKISSATYGGTMKTPSVGEVLTKYLTKHSGQLDLLQTSEIQQLMLLEKNITLDKMEIKNRLHGKFTQIQVRIKGARLLVWSDLSLTLSMTMEERIAGRESVIQRINQSRLLKKVGKFRL